MNPNILPIDIESAHILAWVWSLFKPMIAISQIEKDWHILSWVAKWHNVNGLFYDAIWFNSVDKRYSLEAEKLTLEPLWILLDKADIVVAHNAKRFDVAKINAKFFEHNMSPPSPFKVVDTLQVAKRNFNFSSNKLDHISKLKGIGEKLKTDFDLWLGVMAGDAGSCKKMLRYNKKDVILLEKMYTLMLPWISNHPNVGVFNDANAVECTNCGSTNIHYRGYTYTNAGKYQRYVCKDCGKWSKLPANLLPIEKRKELGRNVPK